MNVPEKLNIGDRFQIKYDPRDDPDGLYAFLSTAWFEVVSITIAGAGSKNPISIELKRVKS